jgi:hypothetical protein
LVVCPPKLPALNVIAGPPISELKTNDAAMWRPEAGAELLLNPMETSKTGEAIMLSAAASGAAAIALAPTAASEASLVFAITRNLLKYEIAGAFHLNR